MFLRTHGWWKVVVIVVAHPTALLRYEESEGGETELFAAIVLNGLSLSRHVEMLKRVDDHLTTGHLLVPPTRMQLH